MTTKIHLVTEGNGYPLAFVLTPGNTHDSKALEPALDAICVPNRRGRPRKRPDSLVADRGYSYQRCRDALRRRGISHVIPERSDQRKRRLHRPGRRPKFDKALYRERNRIERAINRLKQFRRIATRYDKRAWNYHAFVLVGAIVVWVKHLSDTP
jgi:transposase